MNYLLYGPDTFRSRKKLREIIEAYRVKAGNVLNLHQFDAEEDDLSRVPAVAGGQSLFEQKNLIIIERPLAFSRQFGFVRDAMTIAAQDEGALVVLWDGAVGQDAKKILAEAAALADKKQAFELLKGEKLTRWIKEEAKKRGLTLAPAQIARLCALSGGDLWALSGEMEKRVVGGVVEAAGDTAGTTATVFQLGDAFLSSPREALRIAHTLFLQGEDAMRVFSYLTGYARTLTIVKSYLDQGRSIAPRHGIHPFVARKATSQVRGLSEEFLAHLLTRFYEEDVKIKTGLVRPEEALVRLITLPLTLRRVSSSGI